MHQYRHPHPAVTTTVVIFTILARELKVLLVRRPRPPFEGTWALPGGFLTIDEDLGHSAERALARETGVHGVWLEQLCTFGQPDRDPRERVLAVAYYALVPLHRLQARQDDPSVSWYPAAQCPPLAFDHNAIVAAAVERLAAKLAYSTIAFQFMPDEFTLGELQQVYEIIRQSPMDKRNFRKQMLAQDCLEASGLRRNGSHRPATLYRAKRPGCVEFLR